MLIGNSSVLHKSPGRFLAGTIASTDSSGWRKPGMMRSADYPALAGLPNGYYQASWFLPKSAGALSSAYNARIGLAGSGRAVGGVTATGEGTLAFTPSATAWPLDDSVQVGAGSASITFTVANAAGQLISSGEGGASFSLNTNTPLLTASLAAVGSTSFTLSASGALGAEASGAGSASMIFSMAATILPAIDTPPARTASASFAITGALVPYAIGSMVGSTINAEALTTDTIAAAVWQALATSFADAGTMGQKLNSAASGGVDYAALGLAVRDELQAELLRIIELAKVHGLVIGADLVVTPTSRTAGSVAQTIATDGSSTTVSRAP